MCCSGLYVGYVCIYAYRDVDRWNEALINKTETWNAIFSVTNVYYKYSVMQSKMHICRKVVQLTSQLKEKCMKMNLVMYGTTREKCLLIYYYRKDNHKHVSSVMVCW
jgi:hypothetical protein